jgi:hypothetical protein
MGAILFAGGSAVTGTEVVKFGNLRMWAERGLVHIEDGGNGGDYKVVGVRVMLQRMRAIQDIIANSKPTQRQAHSHDQFDRKWLEENQGMLEAMVEVVKRAQVQGMPSDPSAVRDLVRRRPKTVVVPAYGGGL